MFVVNLHIPDPQNPPAVKFPPRCVHCGQPTADFLPLQIPMGVQKRSGAVMLKLNVPLCAEGAKRERGITKVTLVPFLVAGLFTGLPAFAAGLLLTPDNFISSSSREAANAPLVIGAFAGLIAGILGGSLLEMALKLLFTPVYGELLMKRPLTAVAILSGTENVIGLSAALSQDKMQLTLTFEREDIGREFQHLNP